MDTDSTTQSFDSNDMIDSNAGSDKPIFRICCIGM